MDKDLKIMVSYNSEWCRPMAFEEVIRLASQYTVARILERDDFADRMKEQNLSACMSFFILSSRAMTLMLQSDVEMWGTDQKFNAGGTSP